MCEWFTPESLPGWGAVLAALAALVVACRGNSIATRAITSQLRADIVRTNAASLAGVQEVRQIIRREQSSALLWRQSMELDPEISELLEELTDFREIIEKLNAFSLGDNSLSEATLSSGFDELSLEFEEAHKLQILITSVQTEALNRVADLSDLARRISAPRSLAK
ncbi:hypothetical protein [Pararhodobacter sp.]|uniref:hypothetical protein n=1 Tax=Pararhodobacter sp. TaxID=2127056 RepID=UPI002FDEDCCB